MNHIKHIDNFFVNESSSYLPGVDELRDGGYVINVEEIEDGISPERIIVSSKNENATCLSYYDEEENKKESIWIKNSPGVKLEKKGDKINKIVIDGEGRWISKSENRSELEDFLDSFYDHLEEIRNPESVRANDSAKDDLEMILDILDIPGKIKTFDKIGEYEWESKFGDDMLIVITKRSKSDLIGTFKIYKNYKDSYPSIDVRNTKSKKESTFSLSKGVKISEDVGFPGIKSKDPYYKYLIKKSLGIETKKDEDSLVKYLKELVSKESKKESWEEDSHFKNIKKATSLVISKEDVEEICRK